LQDVYYNGSEAEWEEISFTYPQVSLKHFNNIHFNYEEGGIKREPNQNPNINTEIDSGYMPQSINNVTIIEKGTAYGRFLIRDIDGNPAKHTEIVCFAEGEEIGWQDFTDENGYVTVAIRDVTKSGEHKFIFRGDQIQQSEGIVSVTVEPLHFESGFEAVFKTGAGVGLSLGVGASVAGFGAEAKAAEIGVKGSKTTGLSFSQEYSNQKNKVVFSASANKDATVSAKAGLFANISQEDIPGVTVSAADISAEASLGQVSTVGYEDSNFNIKDTDDITELAKFLVVASMSNNISNVLAEYIAEKIDAPINYFENGYSVSLSGGANIGLIEAGNANVALGGINKKSTWTNTTKTFKDDSKEYSTSLNIEDEANLFKVDVGISEAQVPIINIRRIATENMMLNAKENQNGELENITLTASNTNNSGTFFDVTTTDTHVFNFEGNNAKGLVTLCNPLRYFANGNKAFFTVGELKSTTKTLVDNEYSGTYSNVASVSKGKELDLSAEIQLGVDIGVELGVGGFYNYSYEKQNGILENGVIYMQAENDIKSLVEDKALTPEKIISAAKAKAKALIDEVLERVESWVDETGEVIVANGKAIAKSLKNTAKKYKVSIATTMEGLGVASVLAVEDDISLFSTSSVATTIGSPYIVEVTDEDGNQIKDFSDHPLLLEITYTAEDLSKAEVTDIEGMAILRWDEEKGVYVKMGGNIDVYEQKVSLEITMPGQYILAVDNCEPAIVLFSQNHTGKNPVVSAYVSDMSGIDNLRLELDGNTVVDMDNLDQHYDYTTGLLKYETSLEESGEYIFTIYARDTFGNDITQNYGVEINDATPVIATVKELDKTISQSETVTAIVDGDELTSVFLNTYVKTSLGESYLLTVDMVKENGVYTANVPVIENASVAEIWISAYNSFGNKAESERQVCFVISDDEPAVYIRSISDGDVTVESLNLGKTGKILLSVYDEEGSVAGVYAKDISDSLTFEDIAKGCTIKVYAWGDNMKPLCNSFTVNR
jgi:hypothetical protein